MRVLVVEPETLPYEKEINGLEEMQATVGGIIDAIYPWEDRAAIVCNDEALLLDMVVGLSVIIHSVQPVGEPMVTKRKRYRESEFTKSHC